MWLSFVSIASWKLPIYSTDYRGGAIACARILEYQRQQQSSTYYFRGVEDAHTNRSTMIWNAKKHVNCETSTRKRRRPKRNFQWFSNISMEMNLLIICYWMRLSISGNLFTIWAAQPCGSKYSHMFYDHSHLLHIFCMENSVYVPKPEISTFELNGQWSFDSCHWWKLIEIIREEKTGTISGHSQGELVSAPTSPAHIFIIRTNNKIAVNNKSKFHSPKIEQSVITTIRTRFKSDKSN